MALYFANAAAPEEEFAEAALRADDPGHLPVVRRMPVQAAVAAAQWSTLAGARIGLSDSHNPDLPRATSTRSSRNSPRVTALTLSGRPGDGYAPLYDRSTR